MIIRAKERYSHHPSQTNRLGGGYQPIKEEPEENPEEGEIDQEPENTKEDSIILRGDNIPIVI